MSANPKPCGQEQESKIAITQRTRLRTEDVSVFVNQINPLSDARWKDFVAGHAKSSLFHTFEWLEALRRTHGYRPVAFTTSSPDSALENAIVYCRVESWLTGRRLVALPFSDHCEPLVDNDRDLGALLDAAVRGADDEKLRYVEIRPLKTLESRVSGFAHSYDYCFHHLDLQPDCSELFRRFHKSSIQRKIRRAERERLVYSDGTSDTFLEEFYALFLLSRRAQGVPPQPKAWFKNLIACFPEALKIRLARKAGRPIAAILTIDHKDTMVYKYGCSDARFNNLGGTSLLFWCAIQEAKQNGFEAFDFGRSDWHNQGLITFKNRWGATQSTLTYWRHDGPGHSALKFKPAGEDWKLRAAKAAFSHLPCEVLSVVGDLFYKHIG
jgi:CelD/BcsL family acetyltransferase involved in cellulose biosynthesis